jgi:DNA-binding transcriptional MocR family regulator
MRPDDLARELGRGLSAAILTPRAQAATGAAWDAQRALDLADLLHRSPQVGVIEDDHAGPVSGATARTLTARLSRWAHIRSVSKSLGPDLRLAVVAGDEATIARVAGRQALGTGWVSYQLQEIVADLWSDPAPVEHAARVYTARRRALQDALAAHGISATGHSGLTSWIPVADEDRLASGLASAGWMVAPGRRFRIAADPGVRVSYATLQPAEAARFAADLSRSLREPASRVD